MLRYDFSARIESKITGVLRGFCLTCVLVAVATIGMAQFADFSGKYIVLTVRLSDSGSGEVPTMNMVAGWIVTSVAQHSDSVEISLRAAGGGDVTRTYKLDGSETNGTEPDGTPTREKAELRKGHLILSTSIAVKRGALKGVPLVRIQKWDLSKDRRTVTVRATTEIEGDHEAHVLYDIQTVTYLRR